MHDGLGHQRYSRGACRGKKYAEKEIKSQGEKANISADKNILVRLGDGLFVKWRPTDPQMGCTIIQPH